MKLLYIYIKSYGDIFKEQNFSFSDLYFVKYDKNRKQLEIQKNEKNHMNFYGKCISDVTAIVGKNGTGKTSLLNIIGSKYEDRVKFSNLKGDKILDRYFLIYHVRDNIYFFEGIWDDPIKGLELESNRLFQAFYFRMSGSDCIKMDSFDYQYNNFGDEDSDYGDRILYLGSKRNNSTEYFKLFVLNGPRKTKFIERASEKNSDYGEWYKTYLDLFYKQIVSSDNIKVSFSINPLLQKSYNQFFYIDAKPTEEVEKRIDYDIILVDECADDLYKHIFSCVINYIYMEFGIARRGDVDDGLLRDGSYDEEDDSWFRFRDELESFTLNDKVHFQNAFEMFLEIMKNHSQNHMLEEYIQGIKMLFESLYDAREFILTGVDEFKLIMKTDAFEKKVYDVLKRYTELIEIINRIKTKTGQEGAYENPLIVSDVECSEGEKKIITLLSAMRSYCKKFVDMQPIYKEEKCLIVLVDEIENEMHIEWSRTLLKLISELLENEYFEFSSTDKKAWFELGFSIQLIFTTHSPFILSDLKKSSIIALEKVNNTGIIRESLHTFAQNIQRIMADEFFINDCYGAFAQSKIQEVIQIITSKTEISNEDEEYLEMILSEIGEPIIRKKLQEMFYTKIGKRTKWIEQLVYEENQNC